MPHQPFDTMPDNNDDDKLQAGQAEPFAGNHPEAPPCREGLPAFTLAREEQAEIVDLCNRFKQSAQQHAREKKQAMHTCYAYAKGQFVGNDLLPVPSTLGNDHDAHSGRPKVFIPVVRQLIKQLYSYLKLVLFPNDEDYFRVRGKTPEAAQWEEAMTEGLKYKFKEARMTEKMGAFLYNLCWAGNAAALPTVCEDIVWEWRLDSLTGDYVAIQRDMPPQPDLEILNPLNFYPDPNESDPEKGKWGYFAVKKIQELKDSALYFNTHLLETPGRGATRYSGQVASQGLELDSLNGFLNTFEDIEGFVHYDLYYFPHLKTTAREYRNMIVGIAAERVLVRFHPNLFPKGLNPAVFCNWMPDVDTPYGTGPVEDVKELQRLINILYNYMIEVLARIGNRFKVSEGVDLSNLFGIAGGVAIMPPGADIAPLTGDFTEPSMLANVIGTLKAEAQTTSGTQMPFQGASNIDFKKTATELQILQESSISMLREVIEHVSVMGVQRILERLMYLCADLGPESCTVRLRRPDGGSCYVPIDFSRLKSGDFVIELVGVNPSQSKQAQVNGLIQLLGLVGDKPDTLYLGEPIIRKIGELQGIKDIQSLLNKIKERMFQVDGSQPPGIPEA